MAVFLCMKAKRHSDNGSIVVVLSKVVLICMSVNFGVLTWATTPPMVCCGRSEVDSVRRLVSAFISVSETQTCIHSFVSSDFYVFRQSYYFSLFSAILVAILLGKIGI